jgi:hypothetical protein
MPMATARQSSASQRVDLYVAADQTIAACGCDAREAVKALSVANDFLDVQLEELRAKSVDRLRARATSVDARTQG